MEIQSGKIQNNIYILNFPTLFSAEFLRLQDKRVGISKVFLSLFTLFFYIPSLLLVFEHFAHPQFFVAEADADAIEMVDVVDEMKEIYP